MAGSISLSLSQQFDSLGNPLNGGLLHTFSAGTTTPQSAYQDTGLTTALSNPIILDSAGRVPQLFFADGNIKFRLEDANGVTQFAADNVLVIGPSAGGGGGATVDPTTVLQTGWLQPIYGTGVISGFVRANGRTIGNAASAATERANADTVLLFTFLYTADANLAVSGGRGSSAAADYAANKTIALPDFRSRALAGLDDMGNSAAGRLTASFFGTAATVLGAAGGNEKMPGLATGNLPASLGLSISDTRTWAISTINGVGPGLTPVSGGAGVQVLAAGSGTAAAAVVTTTGGSLSVSGGGSATAFAVASPMMLVTIYVKL